MPSTRLLPLVLIVTGAAHLLTIFVATFYPELGDEPSFKVWANQVVHDGIHQAYRSREFGYDWLPLYLYVSKAVGLFYHQSGLLERFGPYHHALTITLKLTMTVFHLVTVWLVSRIGLALGLAERPAYAAALAYGIAPGTVLATAGFGYQDAFHTLIVVLAFWALIVDRPVAACALTVAAALTKPQAIIFLGPIWLYVLLSRDLRVAVRAMVAGAFATIATLFPFLYHGTLHDVYLIYWYVPRIHQWLTGCAHNIWWLVALVPPFTSDGMLFFGLSGLWIGLLTFALCCGVVAVSILKRTTLLQVAKGAAFLAFAFYMVVTQIHENHLYACFPFLVIAAAFDRGLRPVYAVLTSTFAAGLVLTLYLLATDTPVMLGPIRLSTVNATINVGVVVAWSYWYIRKMDFVGWLKRPGQGSAIGKVG